MHVLFASKQLSLVAEDFDDAATQKLAVRFPALADWNTNWAGKGGWHGLLGFLSALHKHNVQEELAELQDTADLPEYHRARRKQHILRKLKKLLPASDSVIHSVIDPTTGRLTSSDSDFAKVANDHWGDVFGRRNSEPSLISNWVTRLPDFSQCRKCTKQDIAKKIRNSKRSSPGPDGIPFACYASTSALSSEILFDALCDLKDPLADAPPRGFNEALLFLLPKTHSHSVDGEQVYGITDTRP